MPPTNRRWSEFLHVFVLTSFSLAQPIFDRVSRKMVYLEDQAITAAAIWWLILTVSLAIPGLIVVVEFSAGLIGQRSREWTHAGVVYLLLVAFGMPIANTVKFFNGFAVLLISLAAAAGGAWTYRRFERLRIFLSFAAPAVVVFPAVFVFYSPVTKLLFPREVVVPPPLAVQNPAPIVLVVFDEFCGTSLMSEKHEIDVARYPNFASFAETATWFRNASSVHQRTEAAVPSLLTGKLPVAYRAPTLVNHPQNLFTLLKSTELYELTAFEPYSRLFPPEVAIVEPRPLGAQLRSLGSTVPLAYLHHVIPSDLPPGLPDIPRAWFGVKEQKQSDDRRTGVFRHNWDSNRDVQFEQFLSFIEPTELSSLYFCHIILPHYPWCYLPSGKKYVADEKHGWQPRGASGQHLEIWGNDALAVDHAHQRYLLQVGYADFLIGRLMERLREHELFDRSLLIVTADHGVAFRAGESRRSPSAATLPDLASVPLFVKLPGQRAGSISDRNVESIDILPTIAEVLGLDLPSSVDGQSLLDESRAARPRKTFYGDDGRVDIDAAFATKYQTLDRMLATFGAGTGDDRLFQIGPHRELIGRSAQDLVASDPSALGVEISTPREFSDASGIMPCLLEGRVRPDPASAPIELAIAVNGTVQAVTRTYTGKDIKNIWGAMLPESAFRPGENELAIFVVTSIGGELRLAPTRGAPVRVAINDGR